MKDVLRQSRIVKRLAPDQPGAKKLARRFGDILVCVRYRQDPARGQRYTTVELLVDEGPMAPNAKRRNLATEVYVLIRYQDSELRRRAMNGGATWDPTRRAWKMSKQLAGELNLLSRIVPPIRPPIDLENGTS